jgi:hypothetical protein
VFAHEGEHYLLPESRATRQVELYRATHFPLEWELHRVLVTGVPLLDTTPFHHEGRWYFFTTLRSSAAAMQGLLFHAASPDGAWTAHPANPISADARRCRAGHLAHQPAPAVPVQDCPATTEMVAGVTRLTPTEYEEREVEFIGPGWYAFATRNTRNSSPTLK